MASQPISVLGRISWMVTSVISLLVVWWGAAFVVQSRYLPSPQEVFSVLAIELASGELLFHVAMTLMRVAASFTVAMVIGSAIGIAMGEIFYLKDLSADCAEDGVYEFMFTAPPLHLPGGAGSPINPQAIK